MSENMTSPVSASTPVSKAQQNLNASVREPKKIFPTLKQMCLFSKCKMTQ